MPSIAATLEHHARTRGQYAERVLRAPAGLAALRGKVKPKILSANALGGVDLPDGLFEDGMGDLAGAVLQLTATLNGVDVLLPIMLLDEEGLAELRDELDAAAGHDILSFVGMPGGVKRADIGEAARAKLRKANKRDGSYARLVAICNRYKAMIDAAPAEMVPWLQKEPRLLVREIPKDLQSTPDEWHVDTKHSTKDPRLPWKGKQLEGLAADDDLRLMCRMLPTYGAPTATRILDAVHGVEVKFTAPCSGAAIAIDGPRRAVTEGRLNRLVHTGERVGMPLRLQVVPDWALLAPRVYNRVAANFLVQDLVRHPKFDLGVAAHAHALRCLRDLARA